MNRKVKYVRLHAPTYCIGAGQLENVFPPHSKTLRELEMVDTGTVLDISFKTDRGQKIELRIPHGNIVSMELLPAEPEAKPTKK